MPTDLSLARQGLCYNRFIGSLDFYDVENRGGIKPQGSRKEGQEVHEGSQKGNFLLKHKARLHRDGIEKVSGLVWFGSVRF